MTTATASEEVVFSPRTRGCSHEFDNTGFGVAVFPAHAGMFRCKRGSNFPLQSFPRARGDVPQLPRPAGTEREFSPRTRGCSCPRSSKCDPAHFFPAHAGMFLRLRLWRRWIRRFPRARGDVPIVLRGVLGPFEFSPRTRGCSHMIVQIRITITVFPAHAGMFHPSVPAQGRR